MTSGSFEPVDRDDGNFHARAGNFDELISLKSNGRDLRMTQQDVKPVSVEIGHDLQGVVQFSFESLSVPVAAALEQVATASSVDGDPHTPIEPGEKAGSPNVSPGNLGWKVLLNQS